jgi:hypothetical protein
MNIYGDMRTCIKCKNKADVVEKGKDYCASCWMIKVKLEANEVELALNIASKDT